MTALGMEDFQRVMQPVMNVLVVFAVAGIGLMAGMGFIAARLLGLCFKRPAVNESDAPSVQGPIMQQKNH